MYAVVKTGGKQYRVAVGDKLKVESVKAEEGEKITLDQVLMIGDGETIQVGTPALDSKVEAMVISNGRGKKLRIVKFRRRQNSRTRTGHRQNFTEIEITSIGGKSSKTTKAASKPKTASKTVSKKVKTAEPKNTTANKSKKKKTAAPGKADDLSKISGVGPVIMGKLEKLGITTLKQVAEFSADDIARIDAELNFKGRIERDDWVNQAKKLMKA